MKFDEILPCLRRGDVVTRSVFYDDVVVFMQVPVQIRPDVVPNMTSLPGAMKKLLKEADMGISYHDQFVMYDFEDGSGTHYSFDGDDLNADDWVIVEHNVE